MRERVKGKLLSPAELEGRCADFKEEWYSVARRIDALAEFSSGEQPGFGRTLKGMAETLEHLLAELSVLTRSTKRHMPELRDELDERCAGVEAGLEELAAKVKDELEKLGRFLEVRGEVSALREEIGKINAELKEVEAKVATLCTKFFERQRELKLAKERIKARVEKGIFELREKFEDKLAGIVGEYGLYLGDAPTTPAQLFEEMLRNPGAIERVQLRSSKPARGFLGIRLKREELGEEARLEVLRFIAQELMEEARRIKDRESARVRSLNREFADLDALEKACRDVERRREELEGYRKELEEKIARLEASLNRNFDDYNEILSIKEELASLFDVLDGEVRDFLEYIASSLGGVEIERDPEKRRLLARMRELEDEVQARVAELERLREERRELSGKLESYVRELDERERLVSELRDEISRLKAALSEREARVAELERRAEAREKELEEEKRSLRGELERLRTEVEELRGTSERLAQEKAELERALAETRQKAAALEGELSELRGEIEQALLVLLEKIRS